MDAAKAAELLDRVTISITEEALPVSVLTAARIVLDESPGPLSADAIYRQMVERGLWRNPHEHPEATVAAAISSDIGRHAGHSRFRRVGAREFASRSRTPR